MSNVQLSQQRVRCNHPSASLGSWMCQEKLQMLSYVLVWYIFVCMLWTYWASTDMQPWPYYCEWYLGQRNVSPPWLYYRYALIDQKQYVVYGISLLYRTLALLGVPLQVSTTGLWYISQFSERVPHGNALGILAVGSRYVFQDQLNWCHDLLLV